MAGASRKMVLVPEESQGLVGILQEVFSGAPLPSFVLSYDLNGRKHELAGAVTGMNFCGGHLMIFVGTPMLGDSSRLLWLSCNGLEGYGENIECTITFDNTLDHRQFMWGTLKLFRNPTPKLPEKRYKA